MLILTQDGDIVNLGNILMLCAEGRKVVIYADQSCETIGTYSTPEIARNVVSGIFNCRLSRYEMPEE